MRFVSELCRTCWRSAPFFVAYLLHANSMAAPCTERGSTAPVIIPAPNLTITRDVPVGAVLGEVSSQPNSYEISCSTPNNVRTSATVRPLEGLTNGIMPVMGSNGRLIPGLGVRFVPTGSYVRGSNSVCTGGGGIYALGARDELRCNAYAIYNGVPVGFSSGNSVLKLVFVKTSDALASASLARETVFTTRVDNYATIGYQLAGGTVVVNPCTFSMPSVVRLGRVTAATMQADRHSAQENFNLEMNCQNNAMVKIRFTPAAGSMAVRGMEGTLSNTAAATEAAAGVNVQLLSAAGEPIPLNTDIDFGAQPAMARYAFRARMSAAPGATVTPGRVTAGARVNFTFY
ncbi:fimbrial protein [Herbaspirillum sp. SJZ102]|uniref:fimbrial protein n=3 Tax=Herbaspirillum TaxID=963 RepID=UPI001172FB8C|nr:fimbrial protein [Herbaspirillum sp. SJZ102]TQK13611.1 type 1 fimbria pilin [Herbaspirillum sp. SJZ130]TQK15614.1 type 1 fimbria pilin [Herbaspirillum sp. SJZ106]TWC71513.1 type 1 fimbria pilin [Herbaspirillum sp. SJZ099]